VADGRSGQHLRASALTSQNADFPRWYQDVLTQAELADNGPVRGTMVIRPYGYAIWERIQAGIDARIKAAGAANAYFPLFIPQSYLSREADHVEGFSPELAVVTHAGGKELEEPIVVRPTSETVIGEYMAKWTQSYRDLPLLLNQWVNVVRWELRPRLFLRTSEFLWQEGHTAHATQADATEYARQIHLDVYHDFMENELALPVFIGLKTDRERFAGAISTLTCEAIMGDGKALQVATSHELGQNFARAFDINFLGQDGDRHLAWTTSWGSSTRMVGALIMAHGDDAGLRVPPRLAPIQAVVLPVRDTPDLAEQARLIHEELERRGVRSTVDRASASFGRRVTDWELKGVPVRVEVGPRDLAEGKATVVRRDTRSKMPVARDALAGTVTSLLEDIQASLYQEALKFRTESTHDVTSVDAAIEVARTGVARLPWQVVGNDGETRLAQEALTVRCIHRADGSLPSSVLEPDLTCVVARAY
jgi:prolyl-tRNA synthetase